MDADELAARSVAGFAEMLACLGRSGARGAAEVRREGALGARVGWAADNHWIDAAVVPVGAAPPQDADGLPHCLWSVADAVPGWAALADATMPCMALELTADRDGPAPPERPSLAVVGALNDEAYGQHDRLAPLMAALEPGDVEAHGLRVDGAWACVAATLALGDDVSIQYVATDARFRRRGLATELLRGVLAGARAAGRTTATLQASPDGRPVYERLGFRTVATLRGFARVDDERSTAPRARTGDGAP
jgi:ribosomal protein S18 acetylase RimI-like enzyme